MKTYAIGENEPFRLNKDSAHRLLMAVAKTGSTIVSAAIDTTCPPTYACFRVQVKDESAAAFTGAVPEAEIAETASGQ